MGVMTREEKVVESHKKAATLNAPVDPGPVPDAETLQQNLYTMQDFRTMRQNDMWWGAREANKVLANAVGLFVGGTVGAGNMVWNIMEHGAKQPGGVSDKPLPENEDTIVEAFSDENVAMSWGGSADHWSYLPLAFMIPDIASKFQLGRRMGQAKDVVLDRLGLIAAGDNAGNRVVRMRQGAPVGNRKFMRWDEAEKKGYFTKPYDPRDLRDTGWYIDDKGTRKFAIDTSQAVVSLKPVLTKHPKIKQLLDPKIKDFRAVQINDLVLEDILVEGAEELFAAYPGLKKLPIAVHVTKTPDGLQLRYGEFGSKGGTLTAVETSGYRARIVAVQMNNARDLDEFKETLFHEIQHVVQSWEGWQNGGDAAFGRVQRMSVDMMRESSAEQRMIDYMDNNLTQEDLSRPWSVVKQKIEAEMKAIGYNEDLLNIILRHNIRVKSFFKAMKDSDHDAKTQIAQDVEMLFNMGADRLSHMIDAMRRDPSVDQEKLSQAWARTLGNMTRDEARLTAGRLYFDGYLGLRGEREARIMGGAHNLSPEEFFGEEGMKWLDVRTPHRGVDPIGAHEVAKGRLGPVPAEKQPGESAFTPHTAEIGRAADKGAEIATGLETNKSNPNINEGDAFWDDIREAEPQHGDKPGRTYTQRVKDEKARRQRVAERAKARKKAKKAGFKKMKAEDMGDLKSSERITEMDLSNVFQMEGNDRIIPVMINPTGSTEIGRFLGKHIKGATALRYIKTKQDGWVIWDADEALHADVAARLGVPEYDIDPDVLAYGDIGLDELPDAQSIDDWFALLDEDIAKGMVR